MKMKPISEFDGKNEVEYLLLDEGGTFYIGRRECEGWEAEDEDEYDDEEYTWYSGDADTVIPTYWAELVKED